MNAIQKYWLLAVVLLAIWLALGTQNAGLTPDITNKSCYTWTGGGFVFETTNKACYLP